MKVHPTQLPNAGNAVRQPFKQLLAEAKAHSVAPRRPAVATVQPGTTAVTAPKTGVLPGQVKAPHVGLLPGQANATRQVARQRVEAEAQRLDSVRSEHHAASAQQLVRGAEAVASREEKVDARVLSLILKELESAFDREPPHVERAVNCDGKPSPQPFRADAGPTSAPPPVRAEQAVALIERIETFVKSARPALALTLNNSLGARVEIERLGPGRIALKLVGQRGPPSADAISRIREELRARGLKVGALSVA